MCFFCLFLFISSVFFCTDNFALHISRLKSNLSITVIEAQTGAVVLRVRIIVVSRVLLLMTESCTAFYIC